MTSRFFVVCVAVIIVGAYGKGGMGQTDRSRPTMGMMSSQTVHSLRSSSEETSESDHSRHAMDDSDSDSEFRVQADAIEVVDMHGLSLSGRSGRFFGRVDEQVDQQSFMFVAVVDHQSNSQATVVSLEDSCLEWGVGADDMWLDLDHQKLHSAPFSRTSGIPMSLGVSIQISESSTCNCRPSRLFWEITETPHNCAETQSQPQVESCVEGSQQQASTTTTTVSISGIGVKDPVLSVGECGMFSHVLESGRHLDPLTTYTLKGAVDQTITVNTWCSGNGLKIGANYGSLRLVGFTCDSEFNAHSVSMEGSASTSTRAMPMGMSTESEEDEIETDIVALIQFVKDGEKFGKSEILEGVSGMGDSCDPSNGMMVGDGIEGSISSLSLVSVNDPVQVSNKLAPQTCEYLECSEGECWMTPIPRDARRKCSANAFCDEFDGTCPELAEIVAPTPTPETCILGEMCESRQPQHQQTRIYTQTTYVDSKEFEHSIYQPKDGEPTFPFLGTSSKKGWEILIIESRLGVAECSQVVELWLQQQMSRDIMVGTFEPQLTLAPGCRLLTVDTNAELLEQFSLCMESC